MAGGGPGAVSLNQPNSRSSGLSSATGALGKARVGKPMARAEAMKLLEGVVARAEDANGSDRWLDWVVELVLYGSLAVEGDDPVGDVDVGVRIEPRFGPDDYVARQEQLIDADGAQPRSIVDTLGFAQVKLFRHLRGRSPRVDLVETGPSRPLPPGAVTRTVYTVDP